MNGQPRSNGWVQDSIFAACVVLGGLAAGTLAALGAGAMIDTARLIGEMTDLKGMAEFPSPAYTCKQFSSYDRKAKSPTENWFANDDHSQFLRVEDRAGPRAIDEQGNGPAGRPG